MLLVKVVITLIQFWVIRSCNENNSSTLIDFAEHNYYKFNL